MHDRRDRGEFRVIRDIISLRGHACLSSASMAGYLRARAASRYSQRRNGFFISEKWISAGTI
jgi:hypothetical protein